MMENNNQDLLPFYKSNNMEEVVFAFPTDELWKLITYEEKGLIKENNDTSKRIVQITNSFINSWKRQRSDTHECGRFKLAKGYQGH